MRKILTRASALCLFVCVTAYAKYPAPPQQYSLVNVSSGQTQHIYRDGNRALIDLYMPKGPNQPVAIHTRTIVDVASKTNLTWDLLDSKVPCDSPGQGDWGDPFGYWDQSVQGMPGKLKQTGKDTVNGMKTTVFEISSPEGTAKLWREDKYGLLVKNTVTPKGGAQMEMFEIRDFKIGKPSASVFVVPARCKWKK
ncbi:MAG TPA: hypothetical protein VF117_07350 [Gammaproteobacteria bacterium]